MHQTVQYSIWVKPTGQGYDIRDAVTNVAALKGVVSATSTNVDVSGITKKEAVFAVALSVTANFATDGLKAIFDHLEKDDSAKVVLCRRTDGSDAPVRLDSPED